MPISAELAETLLAEIKAKKWWQGSLILGSDLSKIDDSGEETEWWIITSQTCNLYNSCFQKIPVFEIVAACGIETCDRGKIRGDNPRILHIEARSGEKVIALELNIQKRRWCPRKILGKLPAPTFYVRDIERGTEPDWQKKQWLDIFVGWLARSYNRITLPDAFSNAIKKSKLQNIFEKKLTNYKDELYGIYFSIGRDSDDQWNGVLGEMLPPYLLNIVLVVYEDVDPEPFKQQLLQQIFNEKIKNPENKLEVLTCAQLALQHKIRLIKDDIEVWSITEIPLSRIHSLVRYSFVDHLSNSSMATPG